MNYLELYKLGEQMTAAWNTYAHCGTTEARMAYAAICDTYEAAERECDDLPVDHAPGCNVAGEQA